MNVVVDNGNVQEGDIFTLFGNAPVLVVKPMLLQDLMVLVKAYNSKSKAIQCGRSGQIPAGFSEFKANKILTLWIWNPTE